MEKSGDGAHATENMERVLSPEEHGKNFVNFDRLDPEVAKYASATAVQISESDDKRLKRMIDNRVLVIMVFTYFLQALDKGTLSFASIMHIRDDLDLQGQQVRATILYVDKEAVELIACSTLGSRPVSTLPSCSWNIQRIT